MVASEPASSCSVDAPSSSNPCCTVLAYQGPFFPSRAMAYLIVKNAFSTYREGGSVAAICMERDPANTVNAQQNQGQVDLLTPLFEAQNCWGGLIAQAPGNGISSLASRQDFARSLQRARCEIHFQVDGDWSAWNSWSTCQSGNDVSTRSRTCDNPLPAMGGANCTGLSAEQQLCPPAATASSSAAIVSSTVMASSTAIASFASSSSTAMRPTNQGNQGASGSSEENIGAAFSVSSGASALILTLSIFLLSSF